MTRVKIFVSVLVAMFSFTLAGCGNDTEMKMSAKQEKEISERLAPVGEVAMEGETSPVAAAAGGGSEPRSGEEIYNTKCMTCHATGAAGAPMLGKADQWAPRIAQGVETLYANAINGIRGMPQKGLCMDCSDEEIHATVDYMVAQSQ